MEGSVVAVVVVAAVVVASLVQVARVLFLVVQTASRASAETPARDRRKCHTSRFCRSQV